MTEYLYDGSFEGLLCALCIVRKAESDGMECRIRALGEGSPDLFCHQERVLTDRDAAARFRLRLAADAGERELLTLMQVHASEAPDKHDLLQRYAGMIRAEGGSVRDRFGLPDISRVNRICDRVAREVCRFTGLVRFRRIDSVHGAGPLYYAAIRPDANIVGFLGPHFAARFADQVFLIHDTGRHVAFWHSREARGIADFGPMPRELRSALASDSESDVQALWKEYFSRIAIPERRNPSLQAKNMPRRYWRDLVEEPQKG